jgi:hypothetical protein
MGLNQSIGEHMRQAMIGFLIVLTINGHAASNKAPGALIDRAKKGDRKAILELGGLGDTSLVPSLREIKGRKNKHFGGAGANAQMALAKLGEQVEFDEITHEANDKDPEVRWNGVRKLEYIGDKRAVGALGRLLQSSESGTVLFGGNQKGKVVYEAPAYAAARSLSKIVQDGPTRNSERIHEDDLAKWREWWKKNSKKFP